MKNLPSIAVDLVHTIMLDYIKIETKGLSKMSTNRIRQASIEKDEWDALQAFEQIASEQQKAYAKTFCKSAMKSYQRKKKKFDMMTEHVRFDIIPKILPKCELSLPVDETSLSSEQAKENKDSIKKLNRDFRLQTMQLYLKITKEEFEFRKDKFDKLLADFPEDKIEMQESNEIPLTQKAYHNDEAEGVYTQKTAVPAPSQIPLDTGSAMQLRTKRQRNALRSTSSKGCQSYTTTGFHAPSIINQSRIYLEKNEEALLKLGPRFIPNNPLLAKKRVTHEVEVVVKKIQKIFCEHGWILPKERLRDFTGSLEMILKQCHSQYPPAKQLTTVENLKRKFNATETVIRKTDKSKVFHLGNLDDYKQKAEKHMNKTRAYESLGNINPLESLVERTNNFLYGLWRNKHIDQKQYEKLKVDKERAELAHLYFLPKAHKPNT
ncbi:unnamed protein product, partial [Adineta ricciae]